MLGHWQAPKRSCPTFFFPHDMLGNQKSGNSAQRIKKTNAGSSGRGGLLLHGIVLRIVSNLSWKDQRAIEQKPHNAACERFLNLTIPGHWLRYTCGWIWMPVVLTTMVYEDAAALFDCQSKERAMTPASRKSGKAYSRQSPYGACEVVTPQHPAQAPRLAEALRRLGHN
jgi:hypothetical protein